MLVFAFILAGLITHGQSVFKDHSIQKRAKEIFNQYPNLDSVAFIFTNDKPYLLYLDEPPLVNSEKMDSTIKNRRVRSFYMLGFESDQFFLKNRYAGIYEFVFQKKLIDKIKKPKDKSSFRISLTREGTYFRAVGGSASGPGAHFNLRRKKAFFDLLNNGLSKMKTPVVDSLLILQAIVEADGWLLKPHEILYGNTGPLYDYFLKVYTDFSESKEKYLYTYGLFMPKLQSGSPKRGLIDIYVRLNPDNTITMSAIGDYRKLMIKNYIEDRNNPVYL